MDNLAGQTANRGHGAKNAVAAAKIPSPPNLHKPDFAKIMPLTSGLSNIASIGYVKNRLIRPLDDSKK
jgi:hypothetical protein